MATIPYNPFTNRSTIMKENEFVGRAAAIDSILSRVRNGDCASIVGPRRIGKSSLLYHLYLTGNRRLEDEAKSKFKFIHIDLQDPLTATVKKFCQHLMKHLGRQLTSEEQKTDELEHLSLLSETLQAATTFPVVLLDEFEKLTERKERFTNDFFNALRAFANQHKLALVTTSQHTLRELTETQGLTSPLWNVFNVQPLGEFVVDDTVDEVTLFLTHFWTGPLQPDELERAYLLSYCSHHPLVMQVVSFWVLRNRELKLKEIALLDEIDKELASYFRDKPELITKWLRTKGLSVFKNIVWGTEELGKIVKNLSPFSIHLKS